MLATDLTRQLAADSKALNDMRTLARTDPKAGVRAAAQQFEAYFLQMVMKSMRSATPADGIFDSEQTRLYTGLLDDQMAQSLSSRGSLGFARMIEAQLAAQIERLAPITERAAADARSAARAAATVSAGANAAAAGVAPTAPAVASTATDTVITAAGAASQAAPLPAADWSAETPQGFVERVWPHALEAAAELGVPPHFLVAHAALESGWGRHEPRRPDGSPSYNLFGIKAGAGWAGDSVSALTDEYAGGERRRQSETFRAYGSYGESFRDYARLLTGSARYAGVLGSTSGTDFANGLQQAGYATDPMYAAKLARIIGGDTLRQALLG